MSESLAKFSPHLLLVDVFPRGVLGELDAALAPRAPTAWLVTRWVRPDYYLLPQVRALIESRYEWVFWCERPDARLRDIRRPQEDLAPVLIRSSAQLPSREVARQKLGVEEHTRLVLVLGAGPVDRQADLLRLLLKIRERVRSRTAFTLCFLSAELSPRTEHGLVVRDLFPALSVFPAADLLVAAGGYHAVHEARLAKVPALFVPQPQRYDDQFRRVERLRVAASPEELEAALEAELAGPRERREHARPRERDPQDGAERLVERILAEARRQGMHAASPAHRQSCR